jgi:hypothetical protein
MVNVFDLLIQTYGANRDQKRCNYGYLRVVLRQLTFDTDSKNCNQ